MVELACPVCGGPVVVEVDGDGRRDWVYSMDRPCGCPVVAVLAGGYLVLAEAPCNPEPPTLY
jgi:hypothetical protein